MTEDKAPARSTIEIGRAGAKEPSRAPNSQKPGSRYVFVCELGRGGMGRVDEVFDELLGRSVAQKSALQEAGGGEALATMLMSEAQTCAQLEHPAIVPVYDVGVGEDGAPYYTMRRVRGRTLQAVLRDAKKPGSRAQLLVLRQVCLAVDYAHSRGVVHRDLKPANVIVGEFGEVYVLDWGIAEVLAGSAVKRVSKKTISAGSPGYMAPEQITGGSVDGRADVFALGAMLYEVLSGARLFLDSDRESLAARATGDVDPAMRVPPGSLGSSRLEALVRACVDSNPDRRPTARFIADRIDDHLDGERTRLERARDADVLAAEGHGIYEAFVALEGDSRRMAQEAEEELANVAPWDDIERKQPALERQITARRIAADAARTLARAETAFLSALGRVEDHEGARAGMARLHFRQFEDAEKQGDAERMAQHLDLARAYDDGPLSLELANVGELVVDCSAEDAQLEIAKYEPRGWLLELAQPRAIRAGEAQRLEVGSWMVIARRGDETIRAPVVVGRAKRHRLRLEWKDVPRGMILVPGGPFFAPGPSRGGRMQPYALPDFAIGELPVTMRQYAEFLDALSPEERDRRVPHIRGEHLRWLEKREGRWQINERLIEGEARRRVPPERELDLPVLDVSWFDALAYTRWISSETGLAFRLPTSLEWDKAARGADGRPFPMGVGFDPCLAKLRESRPEASQPEPVGAFALDVSPYGVRDLAGGVQDWTATMVDDATPPDLAEENRPEVHARQAIFRGGAWTLVHLDALISRVAYRVIDRAGWVGFRLAQNVPGPSSSVVQAPLVQSEES